MSETVRSYGFIAALLKPITDDEREELNEKLWEENSNVRIGYSGELLYIDFNLNKSYRERDDIYGLMIGDGGQDPQGFIDESVNRGLDIDGNTIQPYNCIWYNGSDNPVDMLTKDEFWSNGKKS